MTDWMMEHPWMTFFIAMTLVSNISLRLGWCRRRKEAQP